MLDINTVVNRITFDHKDREIEKAIELAKAEHQQIGLTAKQPDTQQEWDLTKDTFSPVGQLND